MRPHARVGQLEAVTAAQPIVGADHPLRQVGPRPLHVYQAPVVERFRKPEYHPAAIRRIAQPCRAPALEAGNLRDDVAAACFLTFHQRATGARDGELKVLGCRSAAPARPAMSVATMPSSSGVDTTGAPPFTSGSTRRRTKSTLKRNKSSWSRVMAVNASTLG